jgi:hypothetical protein
VVHRILVLVALACSALVVASFALFARDQLAGASAHQQTELASGGPVSPGTLPSSHQVAQPRRFIDSAAKTLDSPFASIVQSDSEWVIHGVPTIFALLVYGVGIGYLARYSSGLT